MPPTSAFDLLILPMLEWTGGIYATFALIHLIQVGFGRLFGSPERRPEVKFSRGSTLISDNRRASNRTDRTHVRAMSLSR